MGIRRHRQVKTIFLQFIFLPKQINKNNDIFKNEVYKTVRKQSVFVIINNNRRTS